MLMRIISASQNTVFVWRQVDFLCWRAVKKPPTRQVHAGSNDLPQWTLRSHVVTSSWIYCFCRLPELRPSAAPDICSNSICAFPLPCLVHLQFCNIQMPSAVEFLKYCLFFSWYEWTRVVRLSVLQGQYPGFTRGSRQVRVQFAAAQ